MRAVQGHLDVGERLTGDALDLEVARLATGRIRSVWELSYQLDVTQGAIRTSLRRLGLARDCAGRWWKNEES